MIQLNQDELAAYHREGREAIGKLAGEIQDSAPAARGSRSRFKERSVSRGHMPETALSK